MRMRTGNILGVTAADRARLRAIIAAPASLCRCRSFFILVVRLRHLHPPDTSFGANVGVKRTTSKL
ncbi:hypothetical protein CHELA40_30030 [Chelatococcus asaccharovorans]|nr:hypothetical protein CHELA17_40031 [Chelatococcus asaccharovorans]CAH1687570.1 hypothetical protein CHELA40_30030 [Chelatococcus asaccharovorans]